MPPITGVLCAKTARVSICCTYSHFTLLFKVVQASKMLVMHTERYTSHSASEVELEPFAVSAESESDPQLAADLRFTSIIAEHFQAVGKLALVVGGYARDKVISQLTGQPMKTKDIDTEVYGVEFDELVEQLQVFGNVGLIGASFGIASIKNPASGRNLDFSIPREDSKIDKGHKGFRVTGSPDMSVREAARRRDLTINALAVNPLTGALIDEYGGVADIKAGILRATDTELFGDDPLRALRVMQFAGRFNFSVDPATAELCKTLDLTELPGKRIGEEWTKLMTQSERPSVGLQLARELGILDQLHPELAVLDQIPQEPEWHPEGDVWEHTVLAVDAAAHIVREEQLLKDEAMVVLFGALCHDLGKATTTKVLKTHGKDRVTAYGHEVAGVKPATKLLESMEIKPSIIKAILPIVEGHLFHKSSPEISDRAIRRFAQRLEPANFRLWDLVSRCDANGRGQAFTPRTASYEVYRRSLELGVAEHPAPNIVQGRHLIEHLGLKPDPAFGKILRYLYDAQLDGEYTTPEGGIEYYRQHESDIQAMLSAETPVTG